MHRHVKAQMKQLASPGPGIEISYVAEDADRWKMDLARVASRFDVECYGTLMEIAWGEVAFVFT
jgi:hypothetical protein